MRQILLALFLLLLFTGHVAAQDAEDIIRLRIQAVIDGETILNLSGLGLTEIPSEILPLAHLDVLDLWGNRLTSVPPEIGQLTNLSFLNLGFNQITDLPSEIGQLTNLQFLYLHRNQLTRLPPEIGQLTNLIELHLEDNQLRHLPLEIGNLTILTCAERDCGLWLHDNPLISPPPEVVEQGTAAVLAYLRNQAWYHLQRLIVGAASGVGMLALLVLGFQFKQRGRRKKKNG